MVVFVRSYSKGQFDRQNWRRNMAVIYAKIDGLPDCECYQCTNEKYEQMKRENRPKDQIVVFFYPV